MLKGQILVVDDEANFRDLLYNFLSKAGYEVNTVWFFLILLCRELGG